MDQMYMKEKPILPLLLSMALPMVISMFVNSLYNIIDSIFVAKISEDAMTALSLVYPVQNLINSIAVGFGVGINAVIAMFLGAGKAKDFLQCLRMIKLLLGLDYNIQQLYKCFQQSLWQVFPLKRFFKQLEIW